MDQICLGINTLCLVEYSQRLWEAISKKKVLCILNLCVALGQVPNPGLFHFSNTQEILSTFLLTPHSLVGDRNIIIIILKTMKLSITKI